jgi:hypothetical protein
MAFWSYIIMQVLPVYFHFTQNMCFLDGRQTRPCSYCNHIAYQAHWMQSQPTGASQWLLWGDRRWKATQQALLEWSLENLSIRQVLNIQGNRSVESTASNSSIFAQCWTHHNVCLAAINRSSRYFGTDRYSSTRKFDDAPAAMQPGSHISETIHSVAVFSIVITGAVALHQ